MALRSSPVAKSTGRLHETACCAPDRGARRRSSRSSIRGTGSRAGCTIPTAFYGFARRAAGTRPPARMLHRRGAMSRVLITDGNERAALAAARSLIGAGHVVQVTAPTHMSLAGVSRGVRSHALATHPLREPAAYAMELADVVRTESIDLLLPITDPSVESVLE